MHLPAASSSVAARTTGAKAAYYGLFLGQRTADVLRAGRFDVAVIQRDLFPFGPPWLERLLAARNARLVYDTDDATYLRPGFTPNTPFQRLRRFDKVIRRSSRSARWVSAATEPLADWAQTHYNSNVSVVPMAVDLAEYERAAPGSGSSFDARTIAGPGLVTGWAGTACGFRRLAALAPVRALELSARHSIVVARVISRRLPPACACPACPVDAHPVALPTSRGLADMRALRHRPGAARRHAFRAGQVSLQTAAVPGARRCPAGQLRASGSPPSLIRDRATMGCSPASPTDGATQLQALIADRTGSASRLAAAGRETVAARFYDRAVSRPLVLDGLSRALV